MAHHTDLDAAQQSRYHELYQAAQRARQQAYAPHSNFAVGAALRCNNSQIILGCNVENAAYGSTMCAERVAIFSFVAQRSAGQHPTDLLVLADHPTPVPPCGACRQVMSEWLSDATIWLANTQGEVSCHRMDDLLPLAFKRPPSTS